MTESTNEPNSPQDTQDSFTRVLVLDVVSAKARLQADASQANRRELVRSAFAAIEGVVWLCSEHIVSAAEQIDAVTTTEALALRQTGYFVTAAGAVVEQPRFLPLQTALRTAIGITERLAPDFSVDFGTKGWSSLRKATEARHRITHPKRLSDLSLSEDDVKACLAAFFWTLQVVIDALEAANLALSKFVSGLRDVFEDLERGDAETWRMYRDLLMSDNT